MVQALHINYIGYYYPFQVAEAPFRAMVKSIHFLDSNVSAC